MGETAPEAPRPRFQIVASFDHPIIQRYQRFIAEKGIEIAGIEFVVDELGVIYTYDVNTNTNYNSDAEAGLYGMRAIARYLGLSLNRQRKFNPKLSAAADSVFVMD